MKKKRIVKLTLILIVSFLILQFIPITSDYTSDFQTDTYTFKVSNIFSSIHTEALNAGRESQDVLIQKFQIKNISTYVYQLFVSNISLNKIPFRKISFDYRKVIKYINSHDSYFNPLCPFVIYLAHWEIWRLK